jgi:hypothetical protein
MNGDYNGVTATGQGLIHRIVNDLKNEVMQRFKVGAANIHAGPAAYSFQTFQNLNIFCFVLLDDFFNHAHFTPSDKLD